MLAEKQRKNGYSENDASITWVGTYIGIEQGHKLSRLYIHRYNQRERERMIMDAIQLRTCYPMFPCTVSLSFSQINAVYLSLVLGPFALIRVQGDTTRPFDGHAWKRKTWKETNSCRHTKDGTSSDRQISRLRGQFRS